MDEITLFTTLKPADPPDDLGRAQAAARRRLTAGVAVATRGAAAKAGRRRLGQATAVAATVAATAIVLPAVLPGGGSAARAWAVDRNRDGTITVTLTREFTDPAGLQRALRSDGVNAVVRTYNAGEARVIRVHGGREHVEKHSGSVALCPLPDKKYQASARVQHAVIQLGRKMSFGAVYLGRPGEAGRWSWTIRPAAMPAGDVLLFQVGEIGQSGDNIRMTTDPIVVARGKVPACLKR